MKRFLFSIVAIAVTGCVAKNEVLRKTEWEKDYGKGAGGVVFSLPQARLRFDYTLDRKTFNAGDHTPVVDYCSGGEVVGESAKAVCAALRDAGIDKSLRFSDAKRRTPGDRMCSTDGSKSETRVLLAEGATLTTDFVPDDKETYIIPLQRSYFQNFEVALDLNANGTIGKGSLSTENLGTQELLAAMSALAMPLHAPAATIESEKAESSLPKSDELDNARNAALGLKRLKETRDEIAARNNDDALASRAVQLAALDARIARAVADFIGEVSVKKQQEGKVFWIPQNKKPSKSTNSEATVDPIARAEWMGESFDACGPKANENIATKEREFRLLVVAWTGQAELAPLASGQFDEDTIAQARGWPYRVPREADIEWHVCDEATVRGEAPTDPTILKKHCERIDGIRQLMPQFGVTLRLPEKTGGRKSAIAPDYYVDGSLKKLTISHVGESPAPVIAAVKTALTPAADMPEPTEVAQLTAEASLINARQALCRLVFSVTATDPLCLGPNPPTTRPESE